MEGSVGPKGDKKAEIENRLHRMFSPEVADSICTIIESMPSLPKKIVVFVLSLTAKQIITVILGLLFANTAVPSVVLVFYAMSNGLPAFEALEAVETNYLVFTAVIMFFTIMLIALFLFPGLLWITDEVVRNLSWFDEQRFGNKSYWINLRWSFSFLPGILLSALACSWLLLNDVNPLNVMFGQSLAISVTLIVLVHFLISYIVFRSGRMGEMRLRTQPRFLRYGELLRNPSAPVMTNVISMALFPAHILIFSQTLADIVKVDKSHLLEFLKGENNLSVASIAFVTSLASLFLTYVTTIWVVRVNVWKVSFAVLFAFAFITLFRPGVVTLLQKYMAAMKIGGGTPIVVSVDREVRETWPGFFDQNSSSIAEPAARYIQSSRLSLILLGKDKIYVKAATTKGGDTKGTFMLHNSRYKEVLFLENGAAAK